MYCVIQEVMRKKPDRYGEPLKIIAYQNQWRQDETKPFTWAWKYSEERFERPHLESYKITLHQSYRESGKVRKRQWTVCTMSYYEVCESWWGDCRVGSEEELAEKAGVSVEELYQVIESKLGPLRERLEAEFHQSPEYIARQEHECVRAAYLEAQGRFCSQYDVDKNDFARCYDIFLILQNPEYLAQIKAQHQARKESWSSYRESGRSTYTDKEIETLKQFYRILAKKFHPDVNRGVDTTEQMKLLNRLKESWGV